MKKTIFLFLLTIISCSDNNTNTYTKTDTATDTLRQLYIDAEKGNAEAQFKLGFRYYFGDQVSLNKDSSEYWLGKAADKGHIIAKKTYDAFFTIIPSIETTTQLNNIQC